MAWIKSNKLVVCGIAILIVLIIALVIGSVWHGEVTVPATTPAPAS